MRLPTALSYWAIDRARSSLLCAQSNHPIPPQALALFLPPHLGPFYRHMLRRVAFSAAAVALLLGILPQVAAHGDEHIETGVHDAPHAEPQQYDPASSYWSHTEHAALMYWHIGFEILAWVVVLPIGESLLFGWQAADRLTWFELSC